MSSRPGQGKQKTLKRGRRSEEAVKPQGTTGALSLGPARGGEPPRGDRVAEPMELVVSKENTGKALGQVRRNPGAPGVDDRQGPRRMARGEPADGARSLAGGELEAATGRRVEIPKPSGGKREPGIPTVLDRLIQQVPTPLFDPMFSEFGYGFGRKAWDAVRRAREYAEGLRMGGRPGEFLRPGEP